MLAVGNVMEVFCPTPAQEAARDLALARADAREDLMAAHNRLPKMLLRKGLVYPDRSAWTNAHREWLRSVGLPLPAERLVMSECLQQVVACERRRDRLDAAVAELASVPEWAPVVARIATVRDMVASDLLATLEAQDEGMRMGTTCSERVQMAVDEAHTSFATPKVRNLVKRVGLRCPEADVRSIDFTEERGLNRLLVTKLSTCEFAERGQNVVPQGPTGTGKTYLACALAKAACQRRMRAHYVRCPDLEDLWRESRERPSGEKKLTRKYAAFQMLALDE